jgi:hypothetical protein
MNKCDKKAFAKSSEESDFHSDNNSCQADKFLEVLGSPQPTNVGNNQAISLGILGTNFGTHMTTHLEMLLGSLTQF